MILGQAEGKSKLKTKAQNPSLRPQNWPCDSFVQKAIELKAKSRIVIQIDEKVVFDSKSESVSHKVDQVLDRREEAFQKYCVE